MGWRIERQPTKSPAVLALVFLWFSALGGCEPPPPKQEPAIWHRNGIPATASSEVFSAAAKMLIVCTEADLARLGSDERDQYQTFRRAQGLPQSAVKCMTANGFTLERPRP